MTDEQWKQFVSDIVTGIRMAELETLSHRKVLFDHQRQIPNVEKELQAAKEDQLILEYLDKKYDFPLRVFQETVAEVGLHSALELMMQSWFLKPPKL